MLCGGQNTYDHVSHYVIDSIKDVFSLLVVTSLLVSPQNFGNCITKIRIKSLGYITSRGPNNALKNQKASMREKFEANFGNVAPVRNAKLLLWMCQTMSLEMS